MVVQLKQSLLSLHAITSPPAAADGGASAAAGNPLNAVMATNAVAQSKGLLEQLRQEEAALQQRLAEIDAVQQYQQVRASILAEQAKCQGCCMLSFFCGALRQKTLENFHSHGLCCYHILHGESACPAQ